MFGALSTVTADRGVQFESALFQTPLNLLDCTSIGTTAYHPAVNGMVERFHSQCSLSPVPSRIPTTESYFEKGLDKCTHMFVRCDRVRQPLESPYEGQFRVLASNVMTCRILRGEKKDVVSVEWVKAALRGAVEPTSMTKLF
nr:unnamed protein product [Spirometra erinaceieuropaei]